jgi:N-acetyl-anhydromuramoyl-L-alanine amidase
MLKNDILFEIDLMSGLLQGAEFLPSPNFSERPESSNINLLVIHNISLPTGEFGGDAISQFFCNTLDFNAHPYYQGIVNLKVSAHLLIRRDGKIIQYVPFNLCAHHAGDSYFKGYKECNHFSVGIELEGTDDIPYTSVQYQRLSLISAKLMNKYPGITLDRIVGHQTIAPHRKTDPGPAFDWGYFFNLVEKDFEHETYHPVDLHHPSNIF